MAVFILIVFVIRLVKLMSQFRSGTSSQTNIEDLKDRASHLKNKYKDLEDADFRDITLPNDENDSFKEDNA